MTTSVKTCGTCGAIKRLSDFYYHPKTLDGRAGKCKECAKAYTTQRRRDAGYKSQKKYESKPETRSARRRYTKVHQAVFWAVNSGKLSKPESCENCGSAEKIEAHHPDYSKPLEVMWLCFKCHRAEHGQEAA